MGCATLSARQPRLHITPPPGNPISRMPFVSKRHLPLLAAIIAGLAILAMVWKQPRPPAEIPPPPQEKPAPAVHPMLSVLASAPDWAELEAYQRTITREDFERLLVTVFTTGEAWRHSIEIQDDVAIIRTGAPENGGIFLLRFAPGGETEPVPRTWRPASNLPPAPEGWPLNHLHIAIDPGHLGGEWARMEERWLLVGDGPPVTEGDMTLFVAKLLKPRLEALGAKVTLVRKDTEPVTTLRPDFLLGEAASAAPPHMENSPEDLQRFAERLFYRTAEIRARAERVNREIQPDLVLCLHFNAEAWGDPLNPTLIDRSHLHLLLNGGYNDDEVSLADQRFAMLRKLLQRTHEEEASVGATVADAFAEVSGLPPFTYPPDSRNVRPVANHPYLWARNLLANRLYDCPVLFMEPYVMNSKIDYERMQAGDYDGLREIAGEMRPSIFREYVEGMVEGLVRHYRDARILVD